MDKHHYNRRNNPKPNNNCDQKEENLHPEMTKRPTVTKPIVRFPSFHLDEKTLA